MFRYYIIGAILLTSGLPLVSPRASSKNHGLMRRLGLTEVKTPSSHHRKRLAVQSRHNSRSDDSHMFVIKLPPFSHYYTHNHPNSIDLPTKQNLPLGFKNNGKPAKVYHWNLPVLKKIASSKMKSRKNDFFVRQPGTWNDIFDKNDFDSKPSKPSYYVPAKPKKSSFKKYFPGNGKPHSFYVIGKSRKANFHRLLP